MNNPVYGAAPDITLVVHAHGEKAVRLDVQLHHVKPEWFGRKHHRCPEKHGPEQVD